MFYQLLPVTAKRPLKSLHYHIHKPIGRWAFCSSSDKATLALPTSPPMYLRSRPSPAGIKAAEREYHKRNSQTGRYDL